MNPLKDRILRGSRIRVLVVDDSVVIRQLVTHALQGDEQIEVAGSAANGVIALQRIPQINPDVVTLDIEMPEMDGLETLRQIRKLHPHLYVIMFSTLTQCGAAATIEALILGANDYVAKAANVGSLDRSMASLRSELIPKIKQFFDLGPEPRKPAVNAQAQTPVPSIATSFRASRGVIAIGISTGGPSALAKVIPMFPKDFSVPILLVQHMPPMFTRLLAERLNQQSSLQVEEAAEGSVVEPGKVLIAPGDYHMTVRRAGNKVLVALNRDERENSCRPAVDVMFRSVGEVYGGSVIAAVLTGMGQDGLRGVETLRARGAYIIAQDEPSSVVWGMPGAVVTAGLANAVVDLDSVTPEILRQI